MYLRGTKKEFPFFAEKNGNLLCLNYSASTLAMCSMRLTTLLL